MPVLGCLFKEFLVVSHDEDHEYDERQTVCTVQADPFWEFQAFSGICFFDEVIPAPTIFGCAEKQINKTAKRKQVVGNDEVFQILNGAAGTKWLNAAPYIETKDTRHGQDQDCNTVDQDCFFAAPVPQIHSEADDVFKYGNDRGKCCKCHKDKE